MHGDLHSRFVTLAEQEETVGAGKSRRSWLPTMEEEKIAKDEAGSYRYEPKRALEEVDKKVELLDLRLPYRSIFGEATKPVVAEKVMKMDVDQEVAEDEEMEDDLEANSSAQILSEVVSRMSTMKTVLQGEVDNQKRDGTADVGVLTGFVLSFSFSNYETDRFLAVTKSQRSRIMRCKPTTLPMSSRSRAPLPSSRLSRHRFTRFLRLSRPRFSNQRHKQWNGSSPGRFSRSPKQLVKRRSFEPSTYPIYRRTGRR